MTEETTAMVESQMGVVKYTVTDEAIESMEREWMPLVVTDITDSDQVAVVREARLKVKKIITQVGKTKSALTAEANAWRTKVLSEEKRIKSRLEPIRDHLQAEEDKVKAEEDRIKAEKAAKLEATIKDRLEKLKAVGVVTLTFQEAAEMDDNEFDTYLFDATETFEEAKRVVAEAEHEKKIEEVRLEKQRAEQEAEADRLADIAKEQKIEQARKEKLNHDIDVQREWFDENIVDEANTVEDLRQFLPVLAANQKGENHPELQKLYDNQHTQAKGILALREAEEKVAKDRKAIDDEIASTAKVAADKQAADKLEKDRSDEKRWRSRLAQFKEIGWNGQEAFDKGGVDQKPVISSDDLINLSDDAFIIVLDQHNGTVESRENTVKKANTARRERLAPDIEKLSLYHLHMAEAFTGVKRPDLSEDESREALTTINQALADYLGRMMDTINEI